MNSTLKSVTQQENGPHPVKPKGLLFTSKRACPSCQNSHGLERVPRPFWLKYLLFFVPARIYYCHHCKHNFVLLGSRKTQV